MKEKNRFIVFIVIILLSSVAIQVPLHNRAVVFFDEGIIFNISEAIANGAVLFKDKPSYVFPGIFYFLALLYKIFGVTYLISRYVMVIVFSLAALFVFLISRHLMTEWIAFLTALAFVAHRVWAFPIWNMIGYAPVCMLFLSLSLLLLMRFIERPRWPLSFFAGMCVAAATMFKQDYGAFAGAGIFLFLFLSPVFRSKTEHENDMHSGRVQSLAAYIFGGLLVSIPVFAYFWRKQALGYFINNAIIIPLNIETTRETTKLIPLFPLLGQDEYVRTHLFEYVPPVVFELMSSKGFVGDLFRHVYAETPIVDIALKTVHNLPYLTLLTVAGIVLNRSLRDKCVSRTRNKITLVLVAAASITLTQHRPFDFAHLMQMFMPVFLLLGFAVDALRESIRSGKKIFYAVFGGLAGLMSTYLIVSVLAAAFLSKVYSAELDLPRGGIYMKPEERNTWSHAIHYIREHTEEKEPILVLPYHSLFYFLAERPNPTRFEIRWPVKPFPEIDEEMNDALESNRIRYVVYSPTALPGIGVFEEFAPDLAQYVMSRYSTEKTFGVPGKGISFIIMKRKSEQ